MLAYSLTAAARLLLTTCSPLPLHSAQLPAETLHTEVPPLLQEAGRQLRQSAADDTAEAQADAAAEDLLVCLSSEQPHGGASRGVACQQAAAATAAVAAAAAEAAEQEGAAAAEARWGGDQRGLALALTLLPPLALAASNPDNFLGALQIAGGYFMTLLYGVLPPLMAWQLRKKMVATKQQQAAEDGGALQPQQQQQSWLQAQPKQPQQQQQQQHEEMVPGGQPVLAGMFSMAMVIEVSRLAADAGLTGGPTHPFIQVGGWPVGWPDWLAGGGGGQVLVAGLEKRPLLQMPLAHPS